MIVHGLYKTKIVGFEMRIWTKLSLLILIILCITATPLLAMGIIGGGGHGGGGHGGGGHGGGGHHGTAVPEIDPSLAPAAIAILSGGVLILKSKFKRK